MSLLPMELFRWGAAAFALGDGTWLYDKDRGYTREIEYQLNLPKASYYALHTRCLAGHPSYKHPDVRSADRVLYRDLLTRVCERVNLREDKVRRFERRRSQFCEEVYRTIRTTRLAMGNVTAATRRFWRIIPRLIFLHPVEMASYAATLSSDLREYGITGRRVVRPHLLWKIFYPHNRMQGLIGGSMKRALPYPYQVNNDLLLAEWAKTMVQVPDYPDLPLFQGWISDWVSFNRPKTLTTNFDIEVSHHASLEVPRGANGEGGAAMLVDSFISLAQGPGPYAVWRDKMLKGINDAKYFIIPLPESTLANSHRRSIWLLTGCLRWMAPFIEHAKTCKQVACEERGMHPRVSPLVVGFKGLKTRIPTMTSAAEQILASVFRSSATHFLKADPRIRGSLNGVMRLPKACGRLEDPVWRSQDLTTATDNHDFSTTYHFYSEMSKYLAVPGWWNPVIKMITGPHEILTRSDSRLIRDKFEELILHGKIPFSQWDLTRYPKGTITRKGQFMGTATSWPLLPLVTLYSFETSSPEPRIEVTREVSVYKGCQMPGVYLPGRFLSDTAGETPKVKLVRVVPRNYLACDTTGDDCIAYMSREHSRRHTSVIERIGGVVSKSKDFEDPTWSIYTEVILRDGEPAGVPPLGTIVSVRDCKEPDWAHFSEAFRATAEKHSISRTRATKLYRLATFYPLVRALHRLGCPTSYPPQVGGLRSYLPEKPSRLSSCILRHLPHLDRLALDEMFGMRPWPPSLLVPTLRPLSGDKACALADASLISFMGQAKPGQTWDQFSKPLVPGSNPSDYRSRKYRVLKTGAYEKVLTTFQENADKRTSIADANKGVEDTRVISRGMSYKSLGALWARTHRWEQVNKEVPDGARYHWPRDYYQYLLRRRGDSFLTLEPTYGRALHKVNGSAMVPWDSACVLAGSQMTLGPFGPSSPSILLRDGFHVEVVD